MIIMPIIIRGTRLTYLSSFPLFSLMIIDYSIVNEDVDD